MTDTIHNGLFARAAHRLQLHEERLALRATDHAGEVAQRIADDSSAHGGLMTTADLAAYHPVVRAPIEGTYRGFRIASIPSRE